MKRIVFTLAFALVTQVANADSVTGRLAVAGLNTYSSGSITFEPPATILFADGSLGVMNSAPGALTMINVPDFATAPGNNLFKWTNGTDNVSMLIKTLSVEQSTSVFLNILGTSVVSQTGFDPTPYLFSFSSTRPDGTTSYSMDIVMAPVVVPEPASLVLLGIALVLGALVFRKKALQC